MALLALLLFVMTCLEYPRQDVSAHMSRVPPLMCLVYMRRPPPQVAGRTASAAGAARRAGGGAAVL